MKMLNEKVCLKLLEPVKEERGGLIIASPKTDVELCEILAVSLADADLKVGDRVLVARDKMAVVPQGRMADKKDILAIID